MHYWRASVREDLGFAPDEEVDKVAWIPVDQVAAHLTYEQDLEFLERAMALPPTSPLIILRHAKAVKRSDFTGKKTTTLGRYQAAGGVSQKLLPSCSKDLGLNR